MSAKVPYSQDLNPLELTPEDIVRSLEVHKECIQANLEMALKHLKDNEIPRAGLCTTLAMNHIRWFHEESERVSGR